MTWDSGPMRLSDSPTMAAALEQAFGRPDPCSRLLYAASLEHGPAEYCTEYAVEGYDLCRGHLQDEEGPDPDDARDLAWDIEQGDVA